PRPAQAEPELLLDLSDDGLLGGLARLGLAAGEHERRGARLADHELLVTARVEPGGRGGGEVGHADESPEAPAGWEADRRGLEAGLARPGLAAGEHGRRGARLADNEQLVTVRVEQDERGAPDVVHADHIPEAPRRWESSRCVSTIPMASMSAYIVVGPTKRNPLLFSAFDRAADSGPVVGISATVRGRGVSAGLNDQMNASRPPSSRSSSKRAAFLMQASILPRWRMIPASASRRSISASPQPATVSGSKPAKASRNRSRFFR